MATSARYILQVKSDYKTRSSLPTRHFSVHTRSEMGCLYWPGVLVICQSSRHSCLLTGVRCQTWWERNFFLKNVTWIVMMGRNWPHHISRRWLSVLLLHVWGTCSIFQVLWWDVSFRKPFPPRRVLTVFLIHLTRAGNGEILTSSNRDSRCRLFSNFVWDVLT